MIKNFCGVAVLSPIRFAQGRLFACHSDAEPTEAEESLSLRAQGKLREESPLPAVGQHKGFFVVPMK